MILMAEYLEGGFSNTGTPSEFLQQIVTYNIIMVPFVYCANEFL